MPLVDDARVAESGSTLSRLLTVQEVADLIRIPVRSVYALVEDRRLPHYKVGRLVRFSPEQVAGYLEAHLREAREDSRWR